jgi:cytochrome c oxidase cbb3-type subunit I/II
VRLEFQPPTVHIYDAPQQEDAASVTTDISTDDAALSDAADADAVSQAGRYMLVAAVLFVLGLAVASLVAFQLVLPGIASDLAYTTYGRLAPTGRILLISGWLPLAGIGLGYFVVSQTTDSPLKHKGLATAALIVIALGAAASAIAVIAGFSTGVQGQEGPVWTRAISMIGFVLAALVITATAKQNKDRLGIAGWYLTAATWWLAASALFGLIPLANGTVGSIQAGFASVGLNELFAMSAAVGLLYFAFSRISGVSLTEPRPLAALGFWSLTLTWAFMGGSKLIYSATPNWYETLTIAFAIGTLVPVLTVAADLALLLKGRTHRITDRASLRYGVVSGLTLAAASVVNLLLVWRATSAVVQYTTWTPGVSTLVILGGASFAIFAANSVRRGGNASAASFHFSWSVIGLGGVAVSLLTGGVVAGFSWIAGPSSQIFDNYGAGYEIAVVSLTPFLWAAAVFGFLYLVAQVVYLLGMHTTSDDDVAVEPQSADHDLEFEGAVRYLTWKRLAWGAAVVWGASALFTAILPMMDDTDTAASITADEYRTYRSGTPELAGRNLYISEGCAECHTQSVRPIVTDVGLGAVSVAGDYAHEDPALITGIRIGPDLTHVASRGALFDSALVAMHLADPRSTVEWSTMPSYSYLSDADIEAIVSYIETLR